MQLGKFSLSLNVKDIHASRVFYETLGFSVTNDHEADHWLVMKNGEAVIGLFQGMFEKHMLTFNPGWDPNSQQLPTFTDIRDIQKQLKEAGIAFEQEATQGAGPAYFLIRDPDGNPILVDQHVDSPHSDSFS
jgi:predicted enzyme related to lactoylglutathione lyase